MAWVWMYRVRDTYAYNEFSPHCSMAKDMLYLTADVGTKSGLALIAFLRATRGA